MQRKFILSLVIFLVCITLSACGEKVEGTCRVFYEDMYGPQIAQDTEAWTLFSFTKVDGFEYEGLYLDPSYQNVATSEHCKNDTDIFVKQSLIEFTLELVTMSDIEVEIEQIFYDNTAYAYTTTNNHVFVRHYFYTDSLFRFLDVTDYLSLHENETVTQISYTYVLTAFLTSEHRVLYLYNHYNSSDTPQFTNLLEVEQLNINNKDIINIQQSEDYLYVLTEDHQLYRVKTDPYLQDPYNIMADLNNILDDNQIENIYFSNQIDSHIIVVDDAQNLYYLNVGKDESLLIKVAGYDNISWSSIIEMLEERKGVIQDGRLYTFDGIAVVSHAYPNTMMFNSDETPIKYYSSNNGSFYLTDENLFYYRVYYDSELGTMKYVNYLESEFLTISNYIPLEENESIIDFLILNNTYRDIYELYVLTNIGNVYISNSFISYYSDSYDPTYPDEFITFDEFHDVTDINTDIPISHIIESNASIMIFYENGDMYFSFIREEGEINVHSDLNRPVEVSFIERTFTVDDDINEILTEFALANNVTLYSIYPREGEYTQPSKPPTKHLTYFIE